MDEEEDGNENFLPERLITPVSSKSDTDIEEILISQRVARNEVVLQFLSLVCLSLMLGLFVIQLEIAWRSRELLLELGLDPDSRQFSYPDFYLDPHNEEHWCWDPDTMLLKVNTSLFVR